MNGPCGLRTATATVDASSERAVATVREITGGGTDHVFEVVGRPETIEQACAMARTRGVITVVGLPRPGDRVEIPAGAFFSEKRLQGSKMGNQFRLEVGGQEYFVDLLLFHRRLRCLVAIELKIGEFKPEHKRQLLQELAWHFHRLGLRYFPEREMQERLRVSCPPWVCLLVTMSACYSKSPTKTGCSKNRHMAGMVSCTLRCKNTSWRSI